MMLKINWNKKLSLRSFHYQVATRLYWLTQVLVQAIKTTISNTLNLVDDCYAICQENRKEAGAGMVKWIRSGASMVKRVCYSTKSELLKISLYSDDPPPIESTTYSSAITSWDPAFKHGSPRRTFHNQTTLQSLFSYQTHFVFSFTLRILLSS
jgi:hypothetical protein